MESWLCDRFDGKFEANNISAWIKAGTNELVQTFSAIDKSTGCDHGRKHFLN